MIDELKWYYKLKKNSLQGLKELITLFPKVIFVYTLTVGMDMFRILIFFKNMIMKKIILIPFTLMVLLFAYYLSLVGGEADEKLFEEKLFSAFYYDTAIEIRDQEGRLAGSIVQPQSFVKNPSLFLEKTPPFLWSLLQEKYDPNLTFDNNATSLYSAIGRNFHYYNGVDILTPFVTSKELILNAIWRQDFTIKFQETLTQQLVTVFTKKHKEKILKKENKLRLSKTFYHQLKRDDGENFKRWLLSERSFFISEGKGYGLRDTAEIFFGKKVEELNDVEQVMLVAMYANPYNTDRSLKMQHREWEYLKKEAIKIVEDSNLINNTFLLTSRISKLSQPKIPYFPDSLMEVVGKITTQNQEAFSTLPSRSRELLGSTKEIIGQELDTFFHRYSINPTTKIITRANINFHLNDNFYFNRYLAKASENLQLENTWVSVVNERGEFVRISQKNSSYKTPPKIGNLGKIFTALLFVDRGDKYYTKYCNKRIPEMRNLGGNEKCHDWSWVESRRLFASENLLPLYDGFTKYRVKNRRGDKSHYTPIYLKRIEILYRNLELQTLQNNEPREDLGLGKLQMSPLDFQVALHKIGQLLYHPTHTFYDAKLINNFDYHEINSTHIMPTVKNFSLHSPTAISPSFQEFFSKEKRITLKTILKTPIYKEYGRLRWMKNYLHIKFAFAQESHIDGTHWLVGVFKKSGHYYTFVIHVEEKELSTYRVKRAMQQILELTLKSINKPNQMKHEYMKMIYND